MNKIYLMCLAFTASLLAWSSSFNIVSAQSPDVVIPVPAEVTMTKGTYKFEEEPKVKVVYSSKGFENPEAGVWFAQRVNKWQSKYWLSLYKPEDNEKEIIA